MKKRWGESSYLLDSLGDNPLPNSILITVDSLDSAGKVTEYAGSMDGVEDVKYYKETVEKLTKVTNFLQIAALVIMAFLIVVSVVVVSNTIKLTVFARSRGDFYYEICGGHKLVHQRAVPGRGDSHRYLCIAGFSRNYIPSIQ